MTITEPTTLASDWLLAAVALALGWRLRAAGPGDAGRPQRLWSAAFLAGAATAFAGGVVHGFAGMLSAEGHAVLWTLVRVGAGFTGSLLLAGSVLAAATGRSRFLLLGAAAGQLAFYLVVAGGRDDIRPAVWNGAATIALTLGLTVASTAGDRLRLAWVAAGLALAAAGLGAQRSGIGLSILNHNDLCHGLQTASLWPFYRAGLGLREPPV
jgi:hypothetical protein